MALNVEAVKQHGRQLNSVSGTNGLLSIERAIAIVDENTCRFATRDDVIALPLRHNVVAVKVTDLAACGYEGRSLIGGGISYKPRSPTLGG
jgi:hypothetical protein